MIVALHFDPRESLLLMYYECVTEATFIPCSELPHPALYAFTRRWCVLGIRMSSRYLATVRRVTQ